MCIRDSPEAVQLILKASILDSFPGQVAMLDMGEPIKILDLARNLLRLSGRQFRMGENVIVTGLRPGENMHEELAAPDETVHATEERRVFLVETSEEFSEIPHGLRVSLENADGLALLDFLVTEFGAAENQPSALKELGATLTMSGSKMEHEA